MVATASGSASPYIGYQTSCVGNATSLSANPSVTYSQLASAIQDITYSFSDSTNTEIYIQYYVDNTQWSQNTIYYEIELYNGSTLLSAFVPCKRNSDNVFGFYNTGKQIMQERVGNGGTFTGGNPV